jgi:hypothetical protein
LQAPPPIPVLLTELAAFPRHLEQLLSSAAVDWLWRPKPDHWSLTEVVCHLRDVEQEVHLPRFESVIAAENAFLAGVAADDWAESRRYQSQDGRAALQTFLEVRQKTITILNGLDNHIWQRRGQHAFFGPTTTHELLNLIVSHDRAHGEQVRTLVRHDG